MHGAPKLIQYSMPLFASFGRSVGQRLEWPVGSHRSETRLCGLMACTNTTTPPQAGFPRYSSLRARALASPGLPGLPRCLGSSSRWPMAPVARRIVEQSANASLAHCLASGRFLACMPLVFLLVRLVQAKTSRSTDGIAQLWANLGPSEPAGIIRVFTEKILVVLPTYMHTLASHDGACDLGPPNAEQPNPDNNIPRFTYQSPGLGYHCPNRMGARAAAREQRPAPQIQGGSERASDANVLVHPLHDCGPCAQTKLVGLNRSIPLMWISFFDCLRQVPRVIVHFVRERGRWERDAKERYSPECSRLQSIRPTIQLAL
ncbi:hypothetical protein V8C26DRAFT_86247 [Trichoderma gracile]